MKILIVAALAALSTVNAATAQEPPKTAAGAPPSAAAALEDVGLAGVRTDIPATPEQIAAAHAEAAAMLKLSGAEDLFDDVTTSANPALRHRMSGVVCAFQHGSSINKVLILNPPRGSSIGCNTGIGERSYSLFLDRVVGTKPSIDQLSVMIVGQIRRRLPDATPSSSVMTASGKDDDGAALPPHRAVVLTRQTPRGMFEEREALGYVGDWLIQQRITEPAANAMAADLMSEIVFMGYQKQVLKAQNSVGPANDPGQK